jgi:ferrous iron transport protein B
MMPAVALVGNPNVGKTTLFNALTGLAHTTGNYPGVTVERVAGSVERNGDTMELIDLPGTYSLAAQSPDEMIVFDILLNQQEGEHEVSAIIAVIDATNVQRNLYLVSQLRDLGKPIIVALNMMDLAKSRDITIDVEALSKGLDAPIVPICAHKRDGIDALKEAIFETVASGHAPNGSGPEFPPLLVEEAHDLAGELSGHRARLGRAVPWQEAFRLLVDRGGYAEKRLEKSLDGWIQERLTEGRKRVSAEDSLAALETRSRYAWIRQIVQRGVKNPTKRIITHSDKIDAILTHKVWGTVAFVAVMGIVFQAIYAWAEPFMNFIDAFFGTLSNYVAGFMAEGPLQSLIVDGVIAGVGSVIIFLPQIVVLSLFIALLEDCGYMARAAFLMDRLLSKVGLSGQSFIPLLSGFACAIPGIMATRTIPNRRDRFATIMVVPLMSCSARLPVYTIMIGALIPNTAIAGGFLGIQGVTLFALYALGIVVAIPVAWILKRTMLRGETPPFLLELPSYKWPQWGTVSRKVWGQASAFLRRAGTLIFAITVVVWALAYFPRSQTIIDSFENDRQALTESSVAGVDLDLALADLNAREQGELVRNSFIGRAGQFLEPVFTPLGWDWRVTVAALASFPAREVVVATMGTLFNVGGEVDETSDSLRDTLQAAAWPNGNALFTIPVALSIMVFFALCCQCGATLAIIRRETGSWRWPAFTFTYMTVLAYIGAFITFHGATALGLGG